MGFCRFWEVFSAGFCWFLLFFYVFGGFRRFLNVFLMVLYVFICFRMFLQVFVSFCMFFFIVLGGFCRFLKVFLNISKGKPYILIFHTSK